ncbi:toprim domain-containing protein [Desulfococcus sp.]|uniref:toprim domain-containing protein n=1 Tax=Desulfococcus sp. TaxID=2025834 RepID=UPI003592F8AD
MIRKIENCSCRDAARLLKRLGDGMEPLSPPIPPSAPDSRFRPFSLRISLNPVASFLQKNKAITIDTALRFETGVAERSAFLKRTIAVRLHDIHGNPLGYCGRRLDPVEIEKWGKWRFPKCLPKSEILFNAHRAACFRHQGIIVVECPRGVMRLWQAGFPNTVALLGTSLSSAQREWLEKTPAILLMLDGDAAGRKAAEKIAASFAGKTQVVTHHLPDGFDPDDLSDRQLRAGVDRYRFFSL